MKTLAIKNFRSMPPVFIMIGFGLTLLLWWLIARASGSVPGALFGPSIIHIILIGLLAWLMVIAVALTMAKMLLQKIRAELEEIYGPYNEPTLWQQHVLYLALFALLALSGTGCLIAIC